MNDKYLKAQLIVSAYKVDSDEITNLLGLVPSKIHKIGDVKRQDRLAEKVPILYDENIWVHEFEPSIDGYIQGYLEDIIDTVAQYKTQLKSAAKLAEVELSIYGSSDEVSIGLHIDAKRLETLQEACLAFDFDVYSLAE